jgi:transposase
MSAATLPTTLEAAHQVIEQLQWRVAQLEKELFGPASERQAGAVLSKEQILLSIFPAPAEPAATQQVLVRLDRPAAEERTRRQPAITVLETVTQRIEPEEKVCPHCGKTKCEIGCEKSERFEYVPAKVVRHEIVRPKLACPCGQGTVSIAALPPSVVAQGQPGPGLVAQVILSKYDDHLPLYRQQQQFERLGVNFPRQTLCDWVEAGALWLQPVVREMKRELLAGDYLQVDETPVRVMDPEVKGKCATGYLWVAGRPDADVIFEFHPGRGKEYAQELTGDFEGYLQRDGYGVYGALARGRPGLIPVGCWAQCAAQVCGGAGGTARASRTDRHRVAQTLFDRAARAGRSAPARTTHGGEGGRVSADFGGAQAPAGSVATWLFAAESAGQSHPLCPGRVGSAPAFSARRAPGNRQQPDRERHSAQRGGQKELAFHRPSGSGLAQRGHLLGDCELPSAGH